MADQDPDDLDVDDAIERMNEYGEMMKAARQLRDNALEAQDVVQEIRWRAAGGIGVSDLEDLESLAKTIGRSAEILEELAQEAPDPSEVAPDGQ